MAYKLILEPLTQNEISINMTLLMSLTISQAGIAMEKYDVQLNNILEELYNRMLRVEERTLRSAFGSIVTATEAHILDVIGSCKDKMYVSEIAAALQITVPTITIALKKLVDKGFVIKTVCEADGRRFWVSLTQQGEKIFEVHHMFHKKMVEAATAGLSQDEKAALFSCAKKLSEFFIPTGVEV